MDFGRGGDESCTEQLIKIDREKLYQSTKINMKSRARKSQRVFALEDSCVLFVNKGPAPDGRIETTFLSLRGPEGLRMDMGLIRIRRRNVALINDDVILRQEQED